MPNNAVGGKGNEFLHNDMNERLNSKLKLCEILQIIVMFMHEMPMKKNLNYDRKKSLIRLRASIVCAESSVLV